jgi:hypothetical protein
MTQRLLLSLIAATAMVTPKAISADVSASWTRSHEEPSTITVESFPSGALVKVNDNVYGRTPCKIHIARSANSSDGFVSITALPNTFQEYVQRRIFAAGEPLPSRLRFDMRIPPPDPAMNVYFN